MDSVVCALALITILKAHKTAIAEAIIRFIEYSSKDGGGAPVCALPSPFMGLVRLLPDQSHPIFFSQEISIQKFGDYITA
jgi:hypothetical protein